MFSIAYTAGWTTSVLLVYVLGTALVHEKVSGSVLWQNASVAPFFVPCEDCVRRQRQCKKCPLHLERRKGSKKAKTLDRRYLILRSGMPLEFVEC